MKVGKRASFPGGGIVMQPPIEKSCAERVIGREIPDGIWHSVCKAYSEFGLRGDALRVSKASRKKNDPEGWHARQTAVVKDIERAMQLIERTKSGHGNFLREARNNYVLENHGASASIEKDPKRLLTQAHKRLLLALVTVEQARPMEIETPTRAESERILARDLRMAFEDGGMEATISDGWTLHDDAAKIDLTLFEQLVSKLGIHPAKTPQALSRWLRAALAG